jgi:hypothetical protein
MRSFIQYSYLLHNLPERVAPEAELSSETIARLRDQT